jgi:hypothetical protein
LLEKNITTSRQQEKRRKDVGLEGYRMEYRIAAAAAIAVIFLLFAGWFAVRKITERRRFKMRQMGRGKSGEITPAE